MQFKIKFQQHAEGTEFCECVVEANDKQEALDKLAKRDFTMYLIRSSEVQRDIIEDYIDGIEEIK